MAPPVLHVQLLGGFRLVCDDLPLTGVNSARLQSLLAYLVLHADAPRLRQHLAFVFWPDTTESQARNNLRQLLYQLRQVLPNPDRFLIADAGTVCWRTDAGQVIDVLGFERLLGEARAAEKAGDGRAQQERLAQAVAAYRGDLLPGCYDEWVLPERERLRQQCGAACQGLIRLLESQREYAAALPVAQRLLRLDPLDEGAYVTLIRLHGLRGEGSAARRVYRAAAEILRRELDAEPGEALRAAYERFEGAPRPDTLAPEGHAGPALPTGTVTFLFTDIEGSTRLWEEHPEDMKPAVARHEALAAEVIAGHGGALVKSRGEGDSLFAVFERATDALAAARTLQGAYSAEPWPEALPLRVRMALHTGEADLRDGDYYGPAVNRCARLRAAAHGGQVLLSQAAADAAAGALPDGVTLRDLSTHRLKDLRQPERLFQLCHPALPGEFPPLRSLPAFAGDLPPQTTPFVGRQTEWPQLRAAWERAAEGAAHLALITGEAGIGKSRLAEELFGWVTRQGFAAAHTRSYGAEGSLSLAPVTEWLRGGAVRPHLAALDPVWRTEIARLLPELLTEDPSLARPEPITEYGRRRRFFEALARGALAAPPPLLLWMDDLHWGDQETLEWLHFLLRFAPRHPLLLLATARREETPPDHPLAALTRQLRAEDRAVVLELSPLDAAETASLAAQVQGHALTEGEYARLYQETEGNPLFVVETVRAGRAADASSLPPRVQAVIAGRLAQLSPAARAVAETGAAVGRAFTLDLLVRAGHDDDRTVTGALDELWQRRIVREQGANAFDFTHDKLREVAYAETSPPQRRALHRRIAHALETLPKDERDPLTAQVAAHFERAGQNERAVPYYQHAGSLAADVYANEDAIGHFSHALELLRQSPAGAPRDAQELNIQLALATLYRVSKGWTSPEEERVLARAIVLSDEVGDVEQRIRALFGLQSLYVVQARYEKAEQTYAALETLFRQTQGTPPPFAGIYLAGVKLHTGQMAEARALFEKIVAVRDDDHIRDLERSQGLNYLVHGLAWNAHALWCLGYPQTALDSARSAVALAEDYAQPFNQALAITYLALLETWRADSETLLARAEEADALTAEYHAPYYRAWAAVLLRFVQADRQPGAARVARLRDAIHAFTDTGARIRLPVYLSLLAQACLKARRLDEGMDALEQALAESLQNDEHWWDAEIHRLRGELMAAQGADPADVETAFRRALDVARGQQAKSLELRAATSLARLWRSQARHDAANDCLAPVCAWFTEGTETPDLQAARALLRPPGPRYRGPGGLLPRASSPPL